MICGAWHVPALGAETPAKQDNDLLKGLPKMKVAATWTPWTYANLSSRSGYGAGVTSPYSLYSEDMATFNEDDCYDQADSAGFINLFGLPLKVRALNDQMLFAKTGEHFPSVDK